MPAQFISVLFAPTPLFTLFPLGTETALVVDCGYHETTIIAVYHGIPLIGSFTAIPAGASAIHRCGRLAAVARSRALRWLQTYTQAETSRGGPGRQTATHAQHTHTHI